MEAERLSRLALSFDRFDPLALSLCGHIRSWLFHDYDHAIELFDRALAANPSAAIAWARSSATFSYIGETREARRRVEIGLRLSPYDAHVFFSYGLAGLAAYAGGDYAEAASWGRRAMTLNPRFVGNLRFLAASLAASGQFKEAHEVGRALLRVNPSVQRRQVRGRACVQGCRQAAAVRRAPGAGGAAGVRPRCSGQDVKQSSSSRLPPSSCGASEGAPSVAPPGAKEGRGHATDRPRRRLILWCLKQGSRSCAQTKS